MIGLVNKTEVRRFYGDYSISEDFFKKLEVEVEHLLLKAKERSEANKRKRVMARDV